MSITRYRLSADRRTERSASLLVLGYRPATASTTSVHTAMILLGLLHHLAIMRAQFSSGHFAGRAIWRRLLRLMKSTWSCLACWRTLKQLQPHTTSWATGSWTSQVAESCRYSACLNSCRRSCLDQVCMLTSVQWQSCLLCSMHSLHACTHG